ncbi:MAG: A/G-specific adenine glycosylase [Xanthomonadales bacterium]|nr:A/G-specific adenine glycosylase [Xanthomonadales bacterium]
MEPLPGFAARLLRWHASHGRHNLPWQQPRTPYRVWLSEIMLQQTQVATVIPYFQRFVDALPDLPALAAAPQDQVLALWSGLGYYSRARNLHAAARACMERHGGELPSDVEVLAGLPGIGRSTAGAIAAQAYGIAAPILDGNVRRVLCRSHGIDGFPGSAAVEKRLWQLARELLPANDPADYTQAQMDLGATVCTRARPACLRCPLAADCRALASERVAELPQPRPRRSLPERSAHWLLLVDPGGPRVLLERRPEQGLWGGLWSLPEFPDRQALDGAVALLGLRHDRATPLPPVRHLFTHFALTAQPWQVEAPASAIAEPGRQRWLAGDALADTGLPQPVRRLLVGVLR